MEWLCAFRLHKSIVSCMTIVNSCEFGFSFCVSYSVHLCEFGW